MMESLWAVHLVDVQIAVLAKTLGSLDDGTALAKRKGELEQELANTNRALHQARADLRDTELTLKSTEERIARNQASLYDGSITDPKELRDLDAKVKELKGLKDKTETTIITLLDQVEELEVRVKGLEEELAQTAAAWERTTHTYQEESTRLRSQLAAQRTRRDELAAGVDAGLLRKYEAIRKSTGDTAVAEVKQGACGACSMAVPAFLLRKGAAEGSVHTCEYCGRLLYFG